jgi:hypothetical protein
VNVCLVSRSRYMAGDVLDAMVRAISVQLSRDLRPTWHRDPAHFAFADTMGAVPPGYAPIVIVDTPDIADALGYHTNSGNRPSGRVFVEPIMDAGGSVLGDPSDPKAASVSATLSHEVLELLGDPWCTYWSDGPDGYEYALELADPVQTGSYFIYGESTSPVAVSNFITPQWFDRFTGPGERYDFLGVLSGPFEIAADGYAIRRQSPGSEEAVFGAGVPEWLRKQKLAALARTARRIAR